MTGQDARDSMVAVTSAEDVCDVVRSSVRVLPCGGGTKPALCAAPCDVVTIDMRGCAGIVEYDPSEYTLTARAGTPLADIERELATHGQSLPFDPLFVDAGATLGGAVASGLNGSGRVRYGGLRDFVIGVQFVDGSGTLLSGGGRVVKNAAGFDYPKLFVGSMGRLGVLVELCVKVFPTPRAWRTSVYRHESLPDAAHTLMRLGTTQLDVAAFDLVPPADVVVRLGGVSEGLAAHSERVSAFVGRPAEPVDDEREYWRSVREFDWAQADLLMKVPLTPEEVSAFDALLPPNIVRRYSAGGNVAWLAGAANVADELRALVVRSGRRALVVRGAGPPLCGWEESPFLARARAALDPRDRFLSFSR